MTPHCSWCCHVVSHSPYSCLLFLTHWPASSNECGIAPFGVYHDSDKSPDRIYRCCSWHCNDDALNRRAASTPLPRRDSNARIRLMVTTLAIGSIRLGACRLAPAGRSLSPRLNAATASSLRGARPFAPTALVPPSQSLCCEHRRHRHISMHRLRVQQQLSSPSPE